MLRVSAGARYALRAMIELSLREGDGRLLLREIADAQGLPARYLERLTIALRRAGLLQAERGPNGGYRLARPAEQITVQEVLEAIEGPLALLECVDTPTACGRSDACAAQVLWASVTRAIGDVLSQTTLADLRKEQRALPARDRGRYHI